MKEQNEINEMNDIENDDIPKNENNIINIKNDFAKNNLMKEINYFFNKDIYNERGTKIKEKETFIKLMNLLNEYIKEKKDFVFLYFKEANINLIKILYNGYTSSDIQNSEEKEKFLSIIKFISNSYFSKNLFYMVYNKLSKIYRRFNLSVNKEILFDNFSKSFDLWNLLFNLDNKIDLYSNYIGLIGNQTLNLINKAEIYHFDCVDIFIEFDEGINKANNSNNDFSFVNVKYDKRGVQMLKSDGILNEKDKENVNNILIRIDCVSISYLFNIEPGEDKNNENKYDKIIEFKNPDNFTKIEILKNYIGKIKLINIKIKLIEDKSQNLEYDIIPSFNHKGYDIVTIQENEEIIELFFDNEILYSQIYNEKLFEDIRYYGGFECFIPIIKIIKYFMAFYKDNNDKINILNDILIKIMKNIIKLVCFRKNNFDNLRNILIPLLAAFAEINHIYPNNLKKNFYSHYTFTLLYILIMNSTFSFSLKKYYAFITGLDNINKLNLNIDEFIIDVNSINISSYGWYIIMIINIIEFILLKFDDINLIPKKLIERLFSLQKLISELHLESLSSLINCSIQILSNICTSENGENKLFDNIQKIENMHDYFQKNIINDEQNLSLVINMIKAYFNLNNYDNYWKEFEEFNNNDINEINIDKKEKGKNYYKNKFMNFFNNFENLFKEKNAKIENMIIKTFKNCYYNQEYLKKIFPFLTKTEKDVFTLESEIYFYEFVDFQKSYHNLMKNIFIFNKLWSDKKLFFNEEKRQKYLKYKSINYYTTNYLRPLIFPYLDYKLSYPYFTNFQLNKDFYVEDENPDEYNFNLDCPELMEYNIKYEEYLLSKIKSKNMMSIYNVCLVKRTHHIKGRLIVCKDNGLLIKKLLFISFPSNIAKNTPCCNVNSNIPHHNKKKENLCFGAIFVCPEKYMNIKIVINIKDIRMILKRIYFYRKSAVEIFTENKSYFFNFTEFNDNCQKCEENCEIFTNFFGFFIPYFVPVVIKETIIGYSRQFQKFMERYINDEKNYASKALEGNKFIQALFGHWYKEIKGINLSTLELLIYLNLLSNRSYNDLFQYPVFPLFFIYDKIQENNFKRYERKLNAHIGFQQSTNKAKQRKQMIQKSFNEEMKELDEDNEIDGDENRKPESPSYFQTHFSTHIYTCGFLIRVFPYSFLSIELQGSGFDSPNRLFFGIENSFYNISCTKSDLRELIPEFYYFPEMFSNINKINFKKRANDIPVNNVIMPHDICQLGKEKDKNNRNSINLDDSYENSDYFKSFKFVEKLRNILESKKVDIISWINIIFGAGQKYQNVKKKDLLFREKSYIDYTKDKSKDFINYRKDKNIMTSAEFGITPIETVFEGDFDIVKLKNRNNYYDINLKEVKQLFTPICKTITDQLQQNEPKPKDNKNEENNIINDEQTRKKSYRTFQPQSIFKIKISQDKAKKVKYKKTNKGKINGFFSNSKLYINCKFECEKFEAFGYKTGKVKLKLKGEKEGIDYEFFDHRNAIVNINYNKRLNMMCTTSIDGFLNVYILPNKLITTIKNTNNNFFKFAFLCSNPFPSIIAIENGTFEMSSFSINGLKIKKVKLFELLEFGNEKKDLWLLPHFEYKGFNIKDRLICIEKKSNEKENSYNCYLIKLPFFDLEEKIKDIKYK